MPGQNPCKFAMQRYVDKRRWLNLWTALLWVFGLTVIVFSCVAILLFIRETWLPGALTVFGTVVNGAGIAWVVTQRKGAETEERAAFKVLTKECYERTAEPQVELQGAPTSLQDLQSLAWSSLFRSPPQGD